MLLHEGGMLSLLTQAEACLWQMRGMESLTAPRQLKPGRGGLIRRPFQRARDQGNGKFPKSKETSYWYEDLQTVWEALAERERRWMWFWDRVFTWEPVLRGLGMGSNLTVWLLRNVRNSIGTWEVGWGERRRGPGDTAGAAWTGII